jgi:small subunit ribosomal protein S19|uniref:Small ribosomal subunit protein uS19c n=1 Tax=Telonemida sp. TaxID=2652706 RepID=A0A5P8DK12_9EUKA|nr:ribosomal protein S19 [Telonemida sp.]
MSRSKWKGPFFDITLLKKTLASKGEFKRLRTRSRSSTILREFIGREFEVHTGNNFVTLKVTNDMLGHKFGEFASTRRYGVKKKKKGKKG